MARHRSGLTPRALRMLAFALAIGGCDRPPDDAQARISQGVAAAGRGNHAEAYWWWRPLADAGMAEAQYHLGWLYANGDGLRVDVPRAISWWQRAAQGGSSEAEFAIGMAYLNGETRTLKKDFPKALEWLARAADHANADAKEILERLIRSETEMVVKAHPQLLASTSLGKPVRVATVRAAIRRDPSGNAERLAETTQGSSLRQIDERKGWLLVILPDNSGLGWIAARDVESVARP